MQISMNKCVGLYCRAFQRVNGENGLADAVNSVCRALKKTVGEVILCPMHMYARDSVIVPQITDKNKCQEKGNYMRRVLKDGDMVMFIGDSVAYNGAKIERGRIGIVFSARSPRVTCNPHSSDPEERRLVSPVITVTDKMCGCINCAPRYCDILKVGVKDICEHVN